MLTWVCNARVGCERVCKRRVRERGVGVRTAWTAARCARHVCVCVEGTCVFSVAACVTLGVQCPEKLWVPQCWKRSLCDACVQCTWACGVHACAASAVLHVRSAGVDVQRMYARVRTCTARAARVCTYSSACGCAQRVGMGARRANRQQCWGEEGGAPPMEGDRGGQPSLCHVWAAAGGGPARQVPVGTGWVATSVVHAGQAPSGQGAGFSGAL